MINNVVLVGRLTKEIDLKKTNSNISTCSFTLAVDKKYKPSQEGAPTADFIQCVAWRQSADFLHQYANKGDVVGIEGQIQTRNYDGQHGKVYVTEVLCERVRLIQQKKDNKQNVKEEANYAQEPSLPISEDDMPWY